MVQIWADFDSNGKGQISFDLTKFGLSFSNIRPSFGKYPQHLAKLDLHKLISTSEDCPQEAERKLLRSAT